MPQPEPKIVDPDTMQIATEIQAILKDNEPQKKHQVTPKLDRYCHDLHRIIHSFLKAYDKETQYPALAFLMGYWGDNHTNLVKYHTRLNHALKVLEDRFRRHEDKPNYQVQLKVINEIFVRYLRTMIRDMPWHKEAIKALFSEDNLDIEVLKETKDGMLQIMDTDGQLAVITGYYHEVRKRADQVVGLTVAAREETKEDERERVGIEQQNLSRVTVVDDAPPSPHAFVPVLTPANKNTLNDGKDPTLVSSERKWAIN